MSSLAESVLFFLGDFERPLGDLFFLPIDFRLLGEPPPFLVLLFFGFLKGFFKRNSSPLRYFLVFSEVAGASLAGRYKPLLIVSRDIT